MGTALITSIATALLAAVLSGCTHRYYALSPLSGVAEIDVAPSDTERPIEIVRDHRVAAITAYMNARLDHWYDPHGEAFGTSGNLEFLDANHKQIAYISFGTGGMLQTRPRMTYTDSMKRQEIQVVRKAPYRRGGTDRAELCSLLGPRIQRDVCERIP